ncbi:glycerophosphodiester phosphodiesterase family protein [Butyrivibrio sp. YAB3001]|uniref:glycerophosphodiester phosphodiesterase family protein n=1 Tax=Butyrivibrio sp. YAB3001 TaxID=1520812 RepID=UPI0008F64FDD|nr:glycerophosphodiester phosphodiesterase family protein [Butyrivibrio sp. YAB3001]SFC59701.1 glycerophosphoryl diester phosphodiesterase [Butyrivibrio sp. YAB3001]
MKIWAHRGCSQIYPENTLTSFEKAMNIPGLAGIELDIQLTKDGELVVIHDERVNRTTEGYGFVKDYSLNELRKLHIFTGIGQESEKIPTMREVMDLLLPKLKSYDGGEDSEGIRLNIELKTSSIRYPGIEEKICELVKEMGVEHAIVYSSFLIESLVKIHDICPTAELGVLDDALSNCLYKTILLEQMWNMQPGTIALHPGGGKIDFPKEFFAGRTVRAWFGGHLYPEAPTNVKMDLERFELAGVTDVFLNEPEKYL